MAYLRTFQVWHDAFRAIGIKSETGVGTVHRAAYARVCDRPANLPAKYVNNQIILLCR
jgi:hypothetical protein